MLTPLPTKRFKRLCVDPAHANVAACNAGRHDAPTEEFQVPSRSSTNDIADVLRRTTLRAHLALKGDLTDPESLRTIHSEVAELEGEVERLGLRGLRPFVGSLRRRIEASL